MPSTRKTPAKTASDTRPYVAYYQVSIARQGESGLGLEAQRAAVARHLAQSKGELASEFTEIDLGKWHTNRPELAAAIAACKRQRATLLIAKLDRLARNAHFISGLMESAADFVACDMPHANRLTIHISAAIAEHERKIISARTKAALEQVKARGVKLGNLRWRESIAKATAAHRRAFAPVEVDAMITGHRTEGLSFRAIAGRLNELGIKIPSGALWYASSVRARTAAEKIAT